MEENKYFTPSIEDIRVGYECEVNYFNTEQFPDKWVSVKAYEEMLQVITPFFERAAIRVPYLTKEQIEKEGWEVTTHNRETNVWLAKKNKFHILGTEDGKNLYSIDTNEIRGGKKYRGEIKDINTFRYICKLLGI